MEISSKLPLRLEPDGTIKVQIRPGNWKIKIFSRHDGPVNELGMEQIAATWADFEIWVFEAKNDLRMVSLQGVPAIDPLLADLPGGWTGLPRSHR